MRVIVIVLTLIGVSSCALIQSHPHPLVPASAGRLDPVPTPPMDEAILILKGVSDSYTICFEVTPEMAFANPGLMTRVVCGPTVGVLRTFATRQQVASR